MSTSDVILPGEDLLLTISQLALGLAGFAGIVGVFRVNWVPQDFKGLRLILELTLAVVFLAQMPSILFLAGPIIGVSSSDLPKYSVKYSSFVLAAFIGAYYFKTALQVHKAKHKPRHPIIFMLFGFPLMSFVVALICNGLWWLKIAPYASALSFLLVAAAVQFFTLVNERREETAAKHRAVGFSIMEEQMDLEIIAHRGAANSRQPPILFVHGAFHAAWCWDEYFLPYFAERGFDAHALSLRGHGASAGHEKLDTWGLADYCDDVSQVCQSLRMPPILVGHSIGALVVQQYVQAHEVPGIVMLAPTLLAPMVLTKLRWAIRFPVETAKTIITGDGNHALPTFRRSFFSSAMPEDQVNRYMTRMQRESKRVFRDISRLRQPNPLGVRVPTLILSAEQDRVPRQVNQRLADAFHADLRTLPVAHDIMLDIHWQMAADQIIEWIIGLRLPASQAIQRD